MLFTLEKRTVAVVMISTTVSRAATKQGFAPNLERELNRKGQNEEPRVRRENRIRALFFSRESIFSGRETEYYKSLILGAASKQR